MVPKFYNGTMAKLKDPKTGKFYSYLAAEAATARVNLRISPSLKQQIADLSGGEVADWIREAIAEKLSRDGSFIQCQHDYIPYWQALDALVMRCKNCGAERSPLRDELMNVLGTVMSVRSDYQQQALTAGKRSCREEFEKAVAEKERQVEYLKEELGK